MAPRHVSAIQCMHHMPFMLQVFMPWEGVAAERAGVQLNVFKLEDYGVPYCYSPVLAAHPDTLTAHPDLVRSFLAATAKGYQYAATHPAEAAEILCAEVAADTAGTKPLPGPLDPDMVLQSQQQISQQYLNPSSGSWGVMDVGVWSKFLDWLSDSGLLTGKVQSRQAGRPHTSSLEELRAGDVGEAIARESVNAADLATNAYLPGGQQ